MELFDVIPASLFSVLTSKNREIYAAALLSMRKSFADDVMLDKEVLVAHLANSLQSNILDIDINAEEGYSEENSKDTISMARFLVRRFKETGWVDTEYARGSRLQEYVTLPPYSIKMLDLLYNLTNEEVAEYDAFMYSMYSALDKADDEYKDYRFIAITSVYEKIQKFESTLKGLFNDLKRHYTRMGHLKTVNQMLSEHFDSYQKDVIKQIYLPLKTKDSISRFKGPIINILSRWLRSPDIMESIVTQAAFQKRFNDREEARDEIISKINFITDKLISLQSLLNSIDERNNEYVQTVTEKISYLLKSDKSIKGKLTKIVEQFAKERFNNSFESLELLQEILNLRSSSTLSDASLFNRAKAERDFGSGEILELPDIDEETTNVLVSDFVDSIRDEYSTSNIVKYMHEQMDEIDRLSTKDMRIDSLHALIMLMYAFIRGFDERIFYRLELRDGNIINHHYSVPDLDFVRKRRIN